MLRSFLEIAPDSDFPLENLPYGVFRPREGGRARVGVAVGDWVLDLAALEEEGFFAHLGMARVFDDSALNSFMAQGRAAWRGVRAELQQLLAADAPYLRDRVALRDAVLFPSQAVELLLPVRIGEYTDFYSSYHHAHHVGTMLRGADNALMPNWKHLPVAYHGRASTVVVSGTPVSRPSGQILLPNTETPIFAPTRSLDFELETGVFVGTGNALGEPIPIGRAEEGLFGMVLVNDWSARDVQAWEYQPLGPFLAKNFMTSISPWVVTIEALETFKRPLGKQEPEPLPHLRRANDWLFDIQLEVTLQTQGLSEPIVLTESNQQNLYWSIQQQVAHHTSNGCALRTGDLLASGTISGSDARARGCMLELTWRGTQPLVLPDGSTRRFLEDGDTVTMRGWAQGADYRVGFGKVSGTVIRL